MIIKQYNINSNCYFTVYCNFSELEFLIRRVDDFVSVIIRNVSVRLYSNRPLWKCSNSYIWPNSLQSGEDFFFRTRVFVSFNCKLNISYLLWMFDKFEDNCLMKKTWILHLTKCNKNTESHMYPPPKKIQIYLRATLINECMLFYVPVCYIFFTVVAVFFKKLVGKTIGKGLNYQN